MARIDYYYGQTLLKTGLEAELGSGVTVEIEPENIEAESCPFVGIYLLSREPTADQPIAAGTIQRYTLKIELWCYQCNPDKAKAFEHRDDLMGNVEIAIMNQRQSKDLGQYGLALMGGEFESGYNETGMYMAGGSVICEIDYQATI